MAGKGAKLTTEQVAEIRNLLGTTTNRNIAKQFGVSEQLISNIKTNVRH
jgi:transposase